MKAYLPEESSIDFLEKERKRLEEVVDKYDFNLLEDKVICASKRMDRVILYFYRKFGCSI